MSDWFGNSTIAPTPKGTTACDLLMLFRAITIPIAALNTGQGLAPHTLHQHFAGTTAWVEVEKENLLAGNTEYAEEMKSQVADIQNIGGPWGGTINGALFLKNFVSAKSKWAHLDIAGPSWANKPWAYSPKGGTGIMVRSLIRLMSQL